MPSGNLRLHWESSRTAQVTITGAPGAWKVGDTPISFPYALTTSTTFTAPRAGQYTLSFVVDGTEIAATPDGVLAFEIQDNTAHSIAPSFDGTSAANDFGRKLAQATANATAPELPVLSTNLARNPRPASTSGFSTMGPSVSVTYIEDPTDGPFVRIRVPGGTASTSFRGAVFAIGSVTGAVAGDRVSVRFEARAGGGWAGGFTPSHVSIAPTSAVPLLTGITPNPISSAWGVQSGVTRAVGQAEGPLSSNVGIYLRIPAEATTDESWVDIRRTSVILNDTSGVDYFDGTIVGARWTGVAHSSTSELVIARSDDLARLGRVGAGIFEGTGSPEGNVAAPPNSEYRDRAGTAGAQVWRKRTGSGATGWVVVDGDTGWRNIAATVTNGWTASLLQIRRVNEQVTLRVEGLDPSARTTTFAFPIPAGFQPRGYGRELLFTAASPPIIRRMDWGAPGFLVANSATTDGLFYGTFTSPVENPAWPTTLPGDPT